MKKFLKLAVLMVVAFTVTPASAQFIFTRPPVGGPNSRPGGLAISPWNQLYFGGPSAVPGSMPPGMIAGSIGAPGFRPGIGVGMGPGTLGAGGAAGDPSLTGTATPNLGGNSLSNPALDLNEGFVTGHPFAFQNHRGYFLNLNAAAGQGTQSGPGTSTLPGTTPIGIQNFGFLGTQSNVPGTRPKRGKENLDRGR
jgi:hypothetical protein